jgi:hypothetical protein
MWFSWGREIEIPENGTRLVLGHLKQLWLDDKLMDQGNFDFKSREFVSSWGLSHYVAPGKVVQVESVPSAS